MIALSKTRSSPPVDAKLTGERLVELSLELLREHRDIRKGRKRKHDFDNGVWKNVKIQLLAETSGKCAYCETPTNAVAYGDVEHYRPKSKYWWLAYCLDNYLVSCALCNQKFKKDKFATRQPPMKAPLVRSSSTDAALKDLSQRMVPDPLRVSDVRKFQALHLREGPLLINPYFENPEEFFAWRADENISEVELISNSRKPGAKAYVEAAKETYGLNRPQLRIARYPTFASFAVLKRVAQERRIPAGLRESVQREMLAMAKSDRPYAGMIRFFESIGGPEDWEEGGFYVPRV